MSVRISSLLPKPDQVDTGAGSFDVYPLTLKEITELIRDHREGMKILFEGGINEQNLDPLIETAPLMVRDIIAKAAKVTDEEEIKAVQSLPGTVQLIALSSIWKLTVPNPKAMLQLLSTVQESVNLKNLNPAKEG